MKKQMLRSILCNTVGLLLVTTIPSPLKAGCNQRWWGGGGTFLSSHPLNPFSFGSGYFGERPYWHSPEYLFRSYSCGVGYGYGYPYHYYPHQEKSPYENLNITQAGELVIQVEPVGALVSVDGTQLMQHQELGYAIGLLTGTHQVEANARGFKPYAEEVGIKAAKRTHLFIQLKKE
jgi:hypothetical protein